MKLVDFENSFYVNDFKTTEIQIENGFHYNMNRRFNISLGINGGMILGIPYEDRLTNFTNSGNIAGIDNFLQYYREIDFIDQTLAKNRFYIGIKPQLGFNITKKWQVQAGTEIRYFFQPFFAERSYFGNTFKEEGVDYILLGHIGINYVLNEQISIGANYDRVISYLRKTLIINSFESGPFESAVRYHSLGLNISYSF
ncbi:hypothetical protein [Marivirga sp.]|uniref:hypothetical protein n=1 Tax=Marivirga sp. TaxID=2018662 RepID=UPI003DA74FF8